MGVTVGLRDGHGFDEGVFVGWGVVLVGVAVGESVGGFVVGSYL